MRKEGQTLVLYENSAAGILSIHVIVVVPDLSTTEPLPGKQSASYSRNRENRLRASDLPELQGGFLA